MLNKMLLPIITIFVVNLLDIVVMIQTSSILILMDWVGLGWIQVIHLK